MAEVTLEKEFGIKFGGGEEKKESAAMRCEGRNRAQALYEAVLVTLKEQSEGWKSRSLFECQWVIRDYKKMTGMPVEEWLSNLERLNENLLGESGITSLPFDKLTGYYEHLTELAKGYEKDAAKLEENLRHVHDRKNEVKQLEKAL